MAENNQPSKIGAILILVFFLGTAFAALYVLRPGSPAPQSSSERPEAPSGMFENESRARQIRRSLPNLSMPRNPRSSLEMVHADLPAQNGPLPPASGADQRPAASNPAAAVQTGYQPGAQNGYGQTAAPGGGAGREDAGQLTPQAANELRQTGVPSSPSGLQSLGATQGLLLKAAQILAAHPAALRVVLNNDLVVQAYMNRSDIQTDCHSADALQADLIHTLGSPAAPAFLSNPQAIATLAGSKLMRAVQSCPSFQQLSSQPDALAGMAAQNPALMQTLANPNFTQGLALLNQRQNR